mgnify:CR=1 FL=1
MSGNYYSIDIWGLLIALVMVAVAAGISEAMRMGIGKTLLWSACRALLQLCAMGFIMEFVIKSNNPWLVLLLVMFMLIAAVQITLSRAKGVPKGLAGPVFLSLVITMLIMISLVTELIIRPQPWYAPQLVVPLTGMLLGNTVSALAVGLSRFFESMKERRDEATSRREAAEKREASIAPLQDELAAVTKRLTEDLPKEAAAADKAVQDAEEKVKALEAERAQLYKDAKEHEETFEQLSKDRTKAEAEEKQWQKTLLDAEGRLVQAKMTGEQSMERLTELGFNTDDARKLQLDGNVADWKAKRSELAQALDELGAVNPNAVTEYEAAQENLSFYEKQQADLVTAKDQLTSVINEIDGAMADRLKEVMAIIAERFQDVFSRLFGGGTAQIAITDPDNILTSGIEFYIQPPGKKRQQLTLLSGGERALTVIALLFSFLDFRPAPFCVLDEVDAALDEANVERFGHYLQHMGDETQFIIVSHRKRTMEAASVLQGVTMAERGISRLLTVTFDEVEEDN